VGYAQHLSRRSNRLGQVSIVVKNHEHVESVMNLAVAQGIT
jgi:hypothetical protein